MTAADRVIAWAAEHGNEEAARLVKAKSEARKRRRERSRPSREAREAKREDRNERAAAIRSAVFARSPGACEWCGAPERPYYPREWHHLVGGGLRRLRESVETTAAICVSCHAAWHQGNAIVLDAAKEWAIRNGFREALRAIEHRIAKANEARTRQGERG